MKLRSLVFAAFLALPFATSFAQVEFSVGRSSASAGVEQPPAPVAGYIWTPGYWGYDSIIIGSRASGFLRRASVYFGPRHGGVGTTVLTPLTRVTGDRMSVFTEALITVMATPETATGADDGVETTSRQHRCDTCEQDRHQQHLRQ